MIKSLLFLGTLIFLSSCVVSPITDEYLVTDQPKSEDIVGIYHFSEQNVVADAEIKNTANSQIEILADGTCNLTDIPVFADDAKFAYLYKGLFTGKCQWKATTNGGLSKGGNEFSTWAICFNAMNFDPATKCANLTSDGKPYNLLFVFGDPDATMMMIFEKTPKKQSLETE